MEQWQPIPEHPDYDVSDEGRIRTRKYSPPFIRKTPTNRETGDVQVNLSKDGVPYTFNVHRLVAQVFLPNPDNLPEVNHKNWDKTNNYVSNLEWSSKSSNALHGLTSPFWQTPPRVAQQLSPAQCDRRRGAMIHLRKVGFTLAEIGAMYGITKQAVHKQIHVSP
jgi:hypothetical protein